MRNELKIILNFASVIIFVAIGWYANTGFELYKKANVILPPVPTPLAKYSIEALARTKIGSSNIKIGKVIKDFPKFTSFKYSMTFDPTLSTRSSKTISGLINVPRDQGKFPVVVMFRGYVDPKNYITGMGTQHAAEFLAQNGFITIAPDFLGYGESDKESSDIFESRFQTYVTAITTLNSVNTIDKWDGKNVFIWGHSNGGQIALTTLEITGVTYPTVLWAPVSKPFPYSILYYTDDATDSGKFLRQKTADFEKIYDSDTYSLTNYLQGIKAPIELHQGTMDEAVPATWSDMLVKMLKQLKVDITYIKYSGVDHNFNPDWTKTIQNTLDFYQKSLK